MVRHLATATLRELGVRRESIDDIALAVTEACANVVQHAGPSLSGHSDFEVRVSVEDVWCRIEVVDSGAGSTPSGPLPTSATRGRSPS